MDYITRKIEQTINEAARYFPVIAVTGPRQSGKSTLLSHLFPDAVKLSLKDVNVRSFAENDPIAFLNQTNKPIFIDEVQKVPMLFEYIQGIVDNHPERKFFLSWMTFLQQNSKINREKRKIFLTVFCIWEQFTKSPPKEWRVYHLPKHD